MSALPALELDPKVKHDGHVLFVGVDQGEDFAPVVGPLGAEAGDKGAAAGERVFEVGVESDEDAVVGVIAAGEADWILVGGGVVERDIEIHAFGAEAHADVPAGPPVAVVLVGG